MRAIARSARARLHAQSSCRGFQRCARDRTRAACHGSWFRRMNRRYTLRTSCEFFLKLKSKGGAGSDEEKVIHDATSTPVNLRSSVRSAFRNFAACVAQNAPPKRRLRQPLPRSRSYFSTSAARSYLLSPDDGINDNVEVTFNPATSVLTVTQPSGHCDEFLNALDAQNAVWDQFDPSDAQQTRRKSWSDSRWFRWPANQPVSATTRQTRLTPAFRGNRVRLLFSFSKAEQWPLFQEKFSRPSSNSSR